jgi:adenylylsulfate kinase-like enzyme
VIAGRLGDPLLRELLFTAADHARKTDPQLAAKYVRLMSGDRHRDSAICHLATNLLTRIATCWRTGQPYLIRDLDGRPNIPARQTQHIEPPGGLTFLRNSLKPDSSTASAPPRRTVATMATTRDPARPQVLHLNGAPGVGKSTLARRWADEHPGTLLLDPDALRTWVSGWREDFVSTGAQIRPVAVAMISAYVAGGGSVVLPQLVANEGELCQFEAAATNAGGRFVEVFLEADDAEQRFATRDRDQPWLDAVHELVEDAPRDHLTSYADRLEALAGTWPGAVRLATSTGDVNGAYSALVAAVG